MIVQVLNQDPKQGVTLDIDLNTSAGIQTFIDNLKALDASPTGIPHQIMVDNALYAGVLDALLQAIRTQQLVVPFQFDHRALAVADSEKAFVNQCIAGLVTHNQRKPQSGEIQLEPIAVAKKKRKTSSGKPGIQIQAQQAVAVQQEQQTEQQQQQEQQQEQQLMQNFHDRKSARKQKEKDYAEQVDDFERIHPTTHRYYQLSVTPDDPISMRISAESDSTAAKNAHLKMKEQPNVISVIRNALGMFNFDSGVFKTISKKKIEEFSRRSKFFVDAISEEALLKLIEHQVQILDGLDFNHLPDGFYVKDLPRDPVNGYEAARVLCYNALFKRNDQVDDYPDSLHLQLKLTEETVAEFNPLALYAAKEVSLAALRTYQDASQGAYKVTQSNPTMENFKAWLGCLGLPPDQMNVLCEHQSALFNDDQVRVLVKIVETHGVEGLTRFIKDYERLKAAGKEQFFKDMILNNFVDASEVGSVKFFRGLNAYLCFSKEEKIWFEKMYEQHKVSLMLPGVALSGTTGSFDLIYNPIDTQKQAGMVFDEMVTVFADFLVQMKKIDATLALPERCPIAWKEPVVPSDATKVTVPYSGFNMRVALTRFLTILENVRSPHEQLRVTEDIDLSHSGYYYAVVHEGLNVADGACAIKGKETVIQEKGEFEFPADLRHVYRVSLADIIAKMTSFLGVANIKPQEIDKFEQLLLRYIANQEQRKDIGFYKRIFKQIKEAPSLSPEDAVNNVIPMMYVMTICTTQAQYEGEKFQSEQALESILKKMLDDFEKPDSAFKKTDGRIFYRFILQSVLNVSNEKTTALVDAFNLDDLAEALSFQSARFSKQFKDEFIESDTEKLVIVSAISQYFGGEKIIFEAAFNLLGQEVLYPCIRNANHTQVVSDNPAENDQAHNENISFFVDNMNAIVTGDLEKAYKLQLVQAFSCLDNSRCKTDAAGKPVLQENEIFVYVKKQLSESKGKTNETDLNEILQSQLKILKSINPEKTKPAITLKEAGDWLEQCKATSETDIHLDFKQRFPQVRFGKEYNDSMQNAFETEYKEMLENIIKNVNGIDFDAIQSIDLFGIKGFATDFLDKLKACKDYKGLVALIHELTSGFIGGVLARMDPSDMDHNTRKYKNMREEIQAEILDLYNRPLEMHARELVVQLGLEKHEEPLVAYQLRYAQKVSFKDEDLKKKIEENSTKREEIKGLMGLIASLKEKDEEFKRFLITSLADTQSSLSPTVIKDFIQIFVKREKQRFHLKNDFTRILAKTDKEVTDITKAFQRIFELYPEYSILSQAKLVNWVIENGDSGLVQFMETVLILIAENAPYQKKALSMFFSMYMGAIKEEDKEPIKTILSAYTRILKEHTEIDFAHLFNLIEGLQEKDSKKVAELLEKISSLKKEDASFVLHFLEKKGNSITDVLKLIKESTFLIDVLKTELKTLLPIPVMPVILDMIRKNAVDDAYQTDPYKKHHDIHIQIKKEDKDKFVEGQVRAIVRHGVSSAGHISEVEGHELLANYRYLTQISVNTAYAVSWPGLSADRECIVQAMKTDELRAVAIALRKNLQNPALLEHDELKIKLQYLAIMREAYYRSTGYFPYSTQMLSVLLNMQNQSKYLFEQIQTGEGKGMIAALQAGLMQAQGYAVDVFSSDFDQLSRRDQAETAEFFGLLGVKTTLLAADSEKEAYLAGGAGGEPGIHYTTASNVSLYQAARMLETGKPAQLSQKRACVCDESDTTVTQKMTNVFSDTIDGADPYINPYEWLYNHMLDFVKDDDVIHELDDFRKFLSTKPLSRIEQALFEKTSERQLEIWLNSAAFVFTLEEDKDFQIQSTVRELATEIKDISVAVILEEGTKKPLPPNAQWGKGVHQLLHLRLNREKLQFNKDGTLRYSFPIDAESRSLTSETNAQVLDKNYHKVLGISGSVRGSQAEQDELFSRYPADVFDLPTHNPSQKKIHTPKYFAQQKPYLKALFQSIQQSEKHQNQPVLILCEDFLDVEALRGKIQADPKLRGYTIQVVGNEKDAEELEGKKGKAGQDGIITIATPRFGRGTDIKPENAYGLKVIETYVATTRDSIQNQGRPARNGQPGEFQRIIDLQTHASKRIEDLSGKKKKELAEYIDVFRMNSENADINYRKFNYQAYDVMSHYLNHLDKQAFASDDWKKMRAEIIAICSYLWDQEKEDCMQDQSIDAFSKEVHAAVIDIFRDFKKDDQSLAPVKLALASNPAKRAEDSPVKDTARPYAAYHNNSGLLHAYFENKHPDEYALKEQSKLFFEHAQRQLRNMSHLGYIDRLRFRYALHRDFVKLRNPMKKNGYESIESTGASEMVGLFDRVLTHCQHHIALQKMNGTLIDALLKPIIDFRLFFEKLGGQPNELAEIDSKQQAFVTHLCEHCSAVKALPVIAKLSEMNPAGMPAIEDSMLYKKFEQELLHSMPGLAEVLKETPIHVSDDPSAQWDRLIQALTKHQRNLGTPLKQNTGTFSILYGFLHQSAKENDKVAQYIELATKFKENVLPKLNRPQSPSIGLTTQV